MLAPKVPNRVVAFVCCSGWRGCLFRVDGWVDGWMDYGATREWSDCANRCLEVSVQLASCWTGLGSASFGTRRAPRQPISRNGPGGNGVGMPFFTVPMSLRRGDLAISGDRFWSKPRAVIVFELRLARSPRWCMRRTQLEASASNLSHMGHVCWAWCGGLWAILETHFLSCWTLNFLEKPF